MRPGRRAVLAVGFAAAVTLFGGGYGLAAGAVILGAWLAGVPRGAFWAASVFLLGAAPIALMAQGLPSPPVVGGDFGTGHLVAHVLVGLAMATAGFAAIWELVEGRMGSGTGDSRGGRRGAGDQEPS